MSNNSEIKLDVISLREKWRKLPDYGCFWSSPDNDRGLKLTPTIEPGRLYVDMKIERHHSGFPGIANGGVSYVILDGLMSWYLMSHLGRAGFTTGAKVEYFKPLHVGKTYRFSVTAASGMENAKTGSVVDLVGTVLADINGEFDAKRPLIKMQGSFFLPNLALAKDILKVDLRENGKELFPE